MPIGRRAIPSQRLLREITDNVEAVPSRQLYAPRKHFQHFPLKTEKKEERRRKRGEKKKKRRKTSRQPTNQSGPKPTPHQPESARGCQAFLLVLFFLLPFGNFLAFLARPPSPPPSFVREPVRPSLSALSLRLSASTQATL